MQSIPFVPTLLIFAARILIPVLITFGLAYLYDYLSARWEARRRQDKNGEVMHLSPECPHQQRVAVALTYWPNSPCWLALELVEGHMPDECLKCRGFQDSGVRKNMLVKS